VAKRWHRQITAALHPKRAYTCQQIDFQAGGISSAEGLARLGETLNADFTLLTADAMRTNHPFCRIIAHEGVLSFSVLEVHLRTLLEYLYGDSSGRSMKVFMAAIRGLTYDELEVTELESCLISPSGTVGAQASSMWLTWSHVSL
jgi:hypothetical protein